MGTAAITTAFAAVLTAAGWLVTHILSVRAEREKQRAIGHLSFVEKQLEGLYGPLVLLVLEGRSTFRDLLSNLGRGYVFSGTQPLSKEDLSLWLFWVDNDFMPRNQRIQELLAGKSHLIHGNEIPESYLTFLDHYNSWQITHKRYKEEGVPYQWHSKANWPKQFEDDIICTFRELKETQAKLIGLIVSESH